MSEIFPIESRALAIAIFYSIDTLAGGFAAPWAGKSLESVAKPLSAVRSKLGEAKPGGGTSRSSAAPVTGR